MSNSNHYAQVYHKVRRKILETESGEPMLNWPAQVIASGGAAGACEMSELHRHRIMLAALHGASISSSRVL